MIVFMYSCSFIFCKKIVEFEHSAWGMLVLELKGVAGAEEFEFYLLCSQVIKIDFSRF